MNTILVWILVGFPFFGSASHPTTIPPMADLASCERVKKSFEERSSYPKLQCVQVAVPR